MIEIAGSAIDSEVLLKDYSMDSIERKIVNTLSSSSEVYRYHSESRLKFELDVRRSIVNAAEDLARSHMRFKVFRKSECNTDYWQRTEEGGFLLENGVLPSEAIKDIYINSRDYGTECSTAMMIVYYKALADIFPEKLFNELFPEIYLMNWQHIDKDFGLLDYPNAHDYLQGDGRYFKNPDVNPLTPEWQGENAFELGDGMYYGHGIGIKSADAIIAALNENRIEGSEVSAYLLDSVKRLGFDHLYDRYNGFVP